MNAFGLYRRYLGVSIRAQLQYPGSFILQTLGHLLITAIEFVGVWALFDRFGSLSGWSLPEVALFYGLADVTFALADAIARGFTVFASLVRSGDFDRILLRPRSTALQILGQELTLRRAGRLVQALVVLIWATTRTQVVMSVPRAALLGFAVLGGVCLFVGLFILEATSAFWTTTTLEVWSAVTYGGNAASQFPMSIYRPWFRRFFTYVIPLVCVTFLPGAAVLGRGDMTWAAVAPLSGVAFLAVTLRIWRLGVRHYTSTGS